MSNQSFDWADVAQGRTFIADLGFKPDVKCTGEDNVPLELGQYAVFVPIPNQDRHQIVEVSQDVEYLKSKYNISNEGILRINAQTKS